MKRFLISALVLSFVLVSGAALANQSNHGCGLGSIIFEGQDGLLSQVCAATTNGIWGNQTFGITSGTSNCETAPSFASNEQLDRFVGDNMDQLAVDISRGGGDYLTTLAVLLDVPTAERAAFYANLQSNFSKIYPDAGINHIDVLNNLETVVNAG